MIRTSVLLAAVAAAVAAPLAGCTQGNNTATIGDDLRLPALSDTPPRRETAIRDDAPSVTSMARAHWGTTPFVVPVDGVAAKPTYTALRQRTDATARQRGDFPTALTALELDGETRAVRWREAGVSPLWTMWDLVAMPYRMYQRPPTEEVASQLDWYARAQPQTPRRTPGAAVREAQP